MEATTLVVNGKPAAAIHGTSAGALASLTYKRLEHSGMQGALRRIRAGTIRDATPFNEDANELLYKRFKLLR